MIGRLSGTVVSRRPDEVVLDVAGVGYQVQIPLSTFYSMIAATGVVSLHVHTHVREDAIQLFGFWTEGERAAFVRLIGVAGIGPKIALAVLSGIGVADLERAVRDADRAMLERIPGIGRKTAERVLLELRDRPSVRRRRATVPEDLSAPETPGQSADGSGGDVDASSALVRLGYSDDAAQRAVTTARAALGSGAPLEDVLRAALRGLVR